MSHFPQTQRNPELVSGSYFSKSAERETNMLKHVRHDLNSDEVLV